MGWNKIVAFQPEPTHRARRDDAKSYGGIDAKLLIHPVVGMTKPGDVDLY